MNKKAIAIALIVLMAVPVIGMMPVRVKAGIADDMQGGNLNAYGYPRMEYYNDTDGYYRGNITGIDATNGAVTHSYNAGMDVTDGDYYGDGNYWCEYVWDATSATYGWKDPSNGASLPPAAGDTLLAISEISATGIGDKSGDSPQNAIGSIDASGQRTGVNYTYATVYYNVKTHDTSVSDDQLSWYGRYEPIPNYDGATTTVGNTWINISIPLPKYTDWNDTGAIVEHRGTFDAWKSYAVFMRSSDDSNYANGSGSYDGWYFVGNASNVVAGPDQPLAAYESGAPTDPSTIDTGHAWLNITGLTMGKHYWFMVRMNFNYGSHHGGYHGGLGSYTTYVSSGSSPQPIVTLPEFTTILVPIVATIGLFIAVTYVYRRKK